MMCVKSKVLPSSIEGLGLFADEFIPKGTVVWRFTLGFDEKFTAEQVVAFPELIRDHLTRYAYLSKKTNLYILAVDNGKYANHSKTPNTNSSYSDDEEEVVTRAIVDIQKGEELTDDYDLFEENSSAML